MCLCLCLCVYVCVCVLGDRSTGAAGNISQDRRERVGGNIHVFITVLNFFRSINFPRKLFKLPLTNNLLALPLFLFPLETKF